MLMYSVESRVVEIYLSLVVCCRDRVEMDFYEENTNQTLPIAYSIEI